MLFIQVWWAPMYAQGSWRVVLTSWQFSHEFPTMTFLLKHVFWWMRATVQQGAGTSVYAAVSPEVEGTTGKYMKKCQVVERPRLPPNPEKVAEELWVATEKLIQSKSQEADQ